MSSWLYQLNPTSWTPQNFRYDIWEGKHWHWGYGSKRGDALPEVGDTIIFFYSPSGGNDPGIYGWAVLEKIDEDTKTLYFIPVTPTNHLKMDPWWDEKETKKLVDSIRGRMKQATLFQMKHEDTLKLRAGIRRWFGSSK